MAWHDQKTQQGHLLRNKEGCCSFPKLMIFKSNIIYVYETSIYKILLYLLNQKPPLQYYGTHQEYVLRELCCLDGYGGPKYLTDIYIICRTDADKYYMF